MKKLLFAPLLFLPLQLEARIGETLDQCKERYGEVINVNSVTKVHMFKKNKLVVEVAFIENKAHFVSISGAIEESTFKKFKEIYSNKWSKYEKEGLKNCWVTPDGKLFCNFSNILIADLLTFKTKEYKQMEIEKEAQRSKNERLKNEKQAIGF